MNNCTKIVSTVDTNSITTKLADLDDADEDEVFLLDAIIEDNCDKKAKVRISVLVKLNDPMIGLDRIMKTVEVNLRIHTLDCR